MIKLNKFNVTDTETKLKARVHYSAGKLINDDRDCVTIYAKDGINNLHKILPDGYKNDTDGMTDYFETGRVRIFEDNPLFAKALERATA